MGGGASKDTKSFIMLAIVKVTLSLPELLPPEAPCFSDQVRWESKKQREQKMSKMAESWKLGVDQFK